MVMNRFTLICALLFAGAGSIVSQPPSQAQPQLSPIATWVVEGNVVDDTGPVADVSIRPGGPWMSLRVATDAIHENALGNSGSVLTDINGHYRLTGTIPGLYSIYPQKDDYEGDHFNGDVQSARNVDLEVGAHITGVDFVIHKAASISGRVLDPDRNPISGAIVALSVKRFNNRGAYLETVAAAGTSDASGGYRFDGLRGGLIIFARVPLTSRTKLIALLRMENHS
jgi:protocatechuate 3,4-dioxygenase beta subunit